MSSTTNNPPLPPPAVPDPTPTLPDEWGRDVLDLLIQGLRVEDERLIERCLRALRSFARPHVEYLEQYFRLSPMSQMQRSHLQTVIDQLRNGRPTTRHPGDDVIDAMLDVFRVDDPTLNELAFRVAASFPPVIVDRLLQEARGRNVMPDHCQRLLTAVERNGGTINWEGAGVLLRLVHPPGLDPLSLQSDRIYWNQFVLRPDRTFGGR